MDEEPIVVVGGGMVGGALARDLGRRGMPVRVLESSPPAPMAAGEAPRVRVSALSRRALDYLEALGVRERLDPVRLAPFDRVETWDAGGGGRLAFSAAELGLDCLGCFVENDHLQRVLLDSLAELPSVRLDAPAAELDIRGDGNGPRLTLAGGGALHPALVVAADGAQSRVRAAAGIGVSRGDYRQHAVVATVRLDPPAATTTWQRFTPEGPQALLPLPGGLASLVWYVDPPHARELLARAAEGFARAAEAAFPAELGRITEVLARSSFPISRLHAARYWAAGTVLVGDAAHVIHPLAGQGVNLGLRDAEALAARLASAGERGLPPDHPPTLAAYEHDRRGDNLLMQQVMNALHYGFTTGLGPLRRLRGLGLCVADRAGPVKRRVLAYAVSGC